VRPLGARRRLPVPADGQGGGQDAGGAAARRLLVDHHVAVPERLSTGSPLRCARAARSCSSLTLYGSLAALSAHTYSLASQ